MEKLQSDYIEKTFKQLQSVSGGSPVSNLRQVGYNSFVSNGIPTSKNEEWRFTAIDKLFERHYKLADNNFNPSALLRHLDTIRLGQNDRAYELVFVNGKFKRELSSIPVSENNFEVLDLEEASGQTRYKEIIENYLGKSSLVVKDGIHALNTSLISGGLFIYLGKKTVIEKPVIVYHLLDTIDNHALALPRSLVYMEEGSHMRIVQTSSTNGTMDSFMNEVMEIVVGQNVQLEYYKLQNDGVNASQVSTTHIRQVGKSFVHGVTISLNGGVIRNNMNLLMEAVGNEAHLYGLYMLNGHAHVDNHTLVDNLKPNCFSNEFYKGIIDESAAGVFNGKIFVRPNAQKTNAYQSNKNILLSDTGTINAKPQLEIFADDVKCSHGCTVGQLDEEALFYLRSRGIPKDHARSILLKAFAEDIVDQIKWEPLKKYVEDLITERLLVK
jgi:Fe-S cluster assembly protein SufD